MTMQELYETVLEKKENAENELIEESRNLLASMNKLIGDEVSIEILNMRKVDTLQGKVDAYTDILNLLKNSKILEIEILNILLPHLSADLFNKEDETGIIHLSQINIDKKSSKEEKNNFYKVRDYLRK